MNRYLAVVSLVVAIGVVLSGCGDDATRGEVITVTGELNSGTVTYLTPTDTITISVDDTAKADAAAVPLGEQEMNVGGAQLPIPFSVEVDTATLEGAESPTISASVRTAEGDLKWRTDTVTPVQMPDTGSEVDLGTITMVEVATSSKEDETMTAETDSETEPPTGEWIVVGIDGAPPIATNPPTISLGSDGRISGTTGCNNFTGSYEIDGDTITVGTLATTRKACVPDLGDQEAAFLGLMDEVTSVSVESAEGLLVLTTGDGKTITAQR